ncbi:MAG: hypothetical protein K6F68_06730 [Clostridiales bacterium]|nr:hypothetical protein [Clostridiales bacterium]
MRTTVNELPILLVMLWGGLIAGHIAALLRLPGKLYTRSLRGRRGNAFLKIAFSALEVLAALAVTAILSAVLVRANGGEPRSYALLAFFAGACLPQAALAGIITPLGHRLIMPE